MITDRLTERIRELNNPSVVGLDPREDYIPLHLREQHKALAHAILAYNKGLIDALYDIVPAVKPQVAFYERYGADGMACYAETILYAKEKGLIVIGDIKRSDIATSAEAYADAHLSGDGAFQSDFITVNPYLGSDAVEPFVVNAKRYDKGLFVLVVTSNKRAGDFQNLETPQGRVYEIVGDSVSEWGADLIGRYGYSPVGAVVGATHPEQARALRKRMPHTFFLVPGYGAQGGTADDALACFDADGGGAIVNSSRGIIAAHLSRKYAGLKPEDYAFAAREAAIEMRDALRKGA
jgi:orotidine-5'-phosphate decarboxylase